MRLLTRTADGEIQLISVDHHDPPPYAILSHTWDHDQEIRYNELVTGTGKSKRGYQKIRFCMDRAAKDGIEHCWIDTCCVDKSNTEELVMAINSMFRWYQGAKKCYVYLADVEVLNEVANPQAHSFLWIEAFRRSRWFTRGWTLQELLAPATVEFFSSEGVLLGTKMSLEQDIHEITRIPIDALRGQNLSSFGIEERIGWLGLRTTLLKEDKVYCLLGICGVFLPLIYGEGEEHARLRLVGEIERKRLDSGVARQEALSVSLSSTTPSTPTTSAWRDTSTADTEACLRSLSFVNLNTRQTDIINAYPGTCNWFFKTDEFRAWRDLQYKSLDSGVLWVKGKPGVGKSTLMKHTLQYCEEIFQGQLIIAYFFNMCGDQLERTYLGMLRSIVFQLSQRDEGVRARFSQRFRERDLVHEIGRLEWRLSDLRDFLRSEIGGRITRPVTLLVDALDECNESDVHDIVELLEALSIKANYSGATVRICFSSRHYPSINMKQKLEIVLEDQKAHQEDIAYYVRERLESDNVRLQKEIERRANGNFLWAFLGISSLNKALDEGRIEEMEKVLDSLPSHANRIGEMCEITNSIPDDQATKSLLAESDSGYGTASRPAMSVEPSQLAGQGSNFDTQVADQFDGTRLDYDLRSLVSENDDIDSQASTEPTRAGLTGQALLAIFLAEDPRFKALCENALARIDKQRFAENIRRLLRSFHKNLAAEAKSKEERAIAGLLRHRRGRLLITHRLMVRIEAKDDRVTDEKEVTTKDRHVVEEWLATVSKAPADLPSQILSDQDESDGRSETEALDFPYTSDLERFLRRSKSFRNLLRDFMLWLLPLDLRAILLSIPKDSIWVTRLQDTSLANSVKAWIEDRTKVKWNWWPLEARKRALGSHEGRVFWQCTCGRRQWIESSIAHLDLVEEVLDLMGNVPLKSHWCRRRKSWMPSIAPSTALSWVMSGTPRATSTSTAASKYTPTGLTAPQPCSISLRSQNSAVLPESGCQQNISPMMLHAQTGAQASPQQTLGFILFGVQGGRRALVPTQVTVYERSTDGSIFKDIRLCYRAQRGRLRLWFSIWRLEYCAVVKFNRLDVKRMVHEYRDLPDQQEYKYNPRAGDSEARNPPLSSHLFEALYYSCAVPCTNWLPHTCSPPPDGSLNIDRFPKREKCFIHDRTSPVWGLEAVFSVSAVHIIVYHLILVAGPFAFFGWWIAIHPEDLQNASVPATIAGGALSLLWMISGILTNKNDHEG